MLSIIINKKLLLTNFYFSDALLRFLNMFVEKYSDKADTFRYDIFNHFVLGQKNIDVSLYDLKGETFYHNIFIESYKLFPPFLLINSFYSGFLPRDEFLFISISLIFSQTKIYSLIPKIKKFLK